MDIPDVTPNFIVQYPWETSSQFLDLGDKNSSDYPDDSFSSESTAPPLLGNGNILNKWPSHFKFW